MSVDDFAGVFTILVLVSLIAAPIGIVIGKKTIKNIYGDNELASVIEARNAKIVAKRLSAHSLNPDVKINMVVFELTNGERMEFAIKDSNIYGIMVEGDLGVLTYQGKKFIKFDREN